MAEANIDQLTLDIVVKNDNATRRINAITRSIEKLNNALKNSNFDKALDKINNVSPASTGGSGGTKKSKDKEWKEQFFSIDKYGKKILEQEIKVSKLNGTVKKQVEYFDEQGKAIKNITTTVDEFGNKVTEVQNLTDKKTKKKDLNTRNLNIFATLGKLNYYRNMARYYGRELAGLVQYAMDYVETQNLWQVANRENIALASEFIEKMNKAYGISEQALMNYQSIFKNMLSALGDLSGATSTKLSQNLTQMALDFASLYNVSVEKAMQKFQAVLSGQVRPIRSVSGYDITETTIYDIYSKMGGEKTMRQLSQLEKRLLRIYAVYDQMQSTGATGDMAKTIESAANQTRIMGEQLKEVKTWTGQILLGWLNGAGIFSYINAVLMTIKEIMKSIAFDSNYISQDWSITALDGVEEVNDAVDELQGKLLSFDRFESLNKSDSGSTLGLDPIIEQLVGNISSSMGDVEMKATKISEKWLEQIGLGKKMYRVMKQNGDVISMTAEEYENLSDAEKSTFKNVESYREVSTSIKAILASLTGIASIFAGFVIGGLIVKVVKLSDALKGLNVVLTLIKSHPIILIISAIAAAMIYLYKTNEDFRDSVNELFRAINEQTEKILKPLMPLIIRITNLITEIIDPLAKILIPILEAITWQLEMMTKIFGPLLDAFAELLSMNDKLDTSNPSNISKKDIVTGGNKVKGFIYDVGQFFSNLFSGKKAINVPHYATGGFPEDGMFFANSGEMVGQFTNGRTAVANNDQIVTGITQGVYNAMMAYNAQTRGNNGSGDVYLDGTKVGKLVARSSHNEMVRTGLVSKSS